jgi:hypothetical protein
MWGQPLSAVRPGKARQLHAERQNNGFHLCRGLCEKDGTFDFVCLVRGIASAMPDQIPNRNSFCSGQGSLHRCAASAPVIPDELWAVERPLTVSILLGRLAPGIPDRSQLVELRSTGQPGAAVPHASVLPQGVAFAPAVPKP